tara:strand:+ start:80 stop:295 length:216 start_codon:yes stop_codon:yes gene_type:complete
MDKIYNIMDRMCKLEYIGALFILFGFGSFLGLVGYVEGLTVIGYTESIKIGINLIFSTFIMLAGVRIYNGK